MSTKKSISVPGTKIDYLVNLVPGTVLTFFLGSVVLAGALGAEEALLLGREPFSQTEIRQLAESDDIRALDLLEEAFERRLTIRSYLGRFAPADLDAELAEALQGLERLDESAAYDRAHELLEQVPATCRTAVTAREVLARQGDISIIREALGRFFDEPEMWGRILGEAARSTDDPRLEDFRDMAGPVPETASRAFFKTRIERELADSTDEWKLADLLFWAEENPSLTAARILSWIPRDSLHEGWVSHLLSVYGGSQTGRTRLRALAALGWRGATNRASVLVEALRDDDPLVVAVAARALGVLRHRKAQPELERLTLSVDERVAAEAIRALISLGGKDEAFRLSEALPIPSFRTALPLMEVLDGRLEDDAAALVRIVKGLPDVDSRHPAIRFLAEGDSPVLAELDIGSDDVEAFYPYIARSSHHKVRSLVLRADGPAQGSALGALLLSPRATIAEKEEVAKILGSSWPDAIGRGGARVMEELDRLTLRDSAAKAYRDPSLWPDDPDTLVVLPGPDARQALERIGSVAAIEKLMLREDRVLSIPALGRLRREGEPEIRDAAEIALIALMAPGSLVIMQRHLEQPEELRALIPALADAPLAAVALQRVSGGEGARPYVQAALFAFYERHPSDFRSLLSIREAPSRRRIHAAMALSSGDERLPLLADSAVHDGTKGIRLMAFRALSETDIGPFATRLHRAAGDDDRDIRWETAMALAPTGEDWAVRLLAAEMNPERSRDRVAFRRVFRRLPAAEGRRLLETMYWDETGNPFTDYLYYSSIGGFSKDEEKRVWALLSEQLDESPFILFMAAGLDIPEAAKAVYSRLQ